MVVSQARSQEEPIIRAGFIAGGRADVVVAGVAGGEHGMMIGADIDFGMISVFGAVVYLIVIAVDGVLNVPPLLGFLALVVGLKKGPAVPLVITTVMTPDDRHPFPV